MIDIRHNICYLDAMDSKLLEQIGLNPTQGKAYTAVITSGQITPPQLATKIGITRTNAYEVLDQLLQLGVIERLEGKKLIYRALNPVALEQLAERKRHDALAHEQKLRAAMPELLNYFYTFSEQPGVRFFQGKQGITDVYEDMLRTRQTIYFLRTTADDPFMSIDFYKRFHQQRTKLGITSVALMPKVGDASDPVSMDPGLFTRTWFRPEDYTAPVEIAVYGNKVSMISFGEEAMATIIESPQIAEAMRQIMQLLARGFSSAYSVVDSQKPSL